MRATDTARAVLERIERCEQPVWISTVAPDELLAAAERLEHRDPSLPLYARPFAVKDNIDVAGMATTAACPGYARVADANAPVVDALLDAGALLVGKTNMDQFATGLVGTRSPYGACSSAFSSAHVSGGSSSGSAVAVALGLVDFALGSDTAGSGRIPAAFNGLVGAKPTRGLVSCRGVVPACASLDCVSVFSRDVAGAASVLRVIAGFDPLDPWSRRPPRALDARSRRIGVPLPGQALPDEPAGVVAWLASQARSGDLWDIVPVDVSPLLEAAPLLYSAWVAERFADLGEIIAARPDGLDPTVASIIELGGRRGAPELFAAVHKLARLARAASAGIWSEVDAVLMPTAPLHPTHASVAADPIGVNERLGSFTNFANLLDLSALALPGPLRSDGLPFGVSLLAPAFHDWRLLSLGAAWMGEPWVGPADASTTLLAVAGAHLSGMPLNGQLTELGAGLVREASTAPVYRLYALPGGHGAARPGLVRVASGGASIAVELWELSHAALGVLLGQVPAPLAIGRVELASGEQVNGFVCEGFAAAGARDITDYGGWRAFVEEAVR